MQIFENYGAPSRLGAPYGDILSRDDLNTATDCWYLCWNNPFCAAATWVDSAYQCNIKGGIYLHGAIGFSSINLSVPNCQQTLGPH